MLRSGGFAGREAAQNNEGNERNEVSGIVWCRDAKGPETVRRTIAYCGIAPVAGSDVGGLRQKGRLRMGELRESFKF